MRGMAQCAAAVAFVCLLFTVGGTRALPLSELTATKTATCDEGYYGEACGGVLVQTSPTTYCLEEAEGGAPYLCFDVYPLACSSGAGASFLAFPSGEAAVFMDNAFIAEGETSAELCRRGIPRGPGDGCEEGDACVFLEEIELSGGVVTANASFEFTCVSDDTVDPLSFDFGSRTFINSECGDAGTYYPAADLDLTSGGVEGNGLYLNADNCVSDGDSPLFCPYALTDPCDSDTAVVVSRSGMAYLVPINGESESSSCSQEGCVEVSDAVFASNGTVTFQLSYVAATNSSFTFLEVVVTPAECGAHYGGDDDDDNVSHDYTQLLWEILAAGVMVIFCLALVAVAVVVVMYRKKHGDPSGYGMMGSDPDSLLEELGDEEATDDVDEEAQA